MFMPSKCVTKLCEGETKKKRLGAWEGAGGGFTEFVISNLTFI